MSLKWYHKYFKTQSPNIMHSNDVYGVFICVRVRV